MHARNSQGQRHVLFALLRYEDSAFSSVSRKTASTLSHMSGEGWFRYKSTGSEICFLKLRWKKPRQMSLTALTATRTYLDDVNHLLSLVLPALISNDARLFAEQPELLLV